MTDVLDPLLDPWRSGIARRALVELIVLGAVCGPLSVWVTSYRLSYGAESLAHGMLPGLVLAALAGAPLIGGAAVGVFACAALVALVSRDERIGTDTATAVVVTGLLGLGALLALSPDAPRRLDELLFGDPLAATDADLLAAGVLALGGGGALALLHRPLAAAALDPTAAGAMGVRAGLVRLGLLVLLGAAVAVAASGLGALLVLAVLVAPAAAVSGRVRSPGRALLAAGAVAVGAAVTGVYASFHLGSAAGASVALALCAAAAIGRAAPVRRPPAEASAAGR
jgi:ABC-type Mn2+/Zn2+ transport system permease subunit